VVVKKADYLASDMPESASLGGWKDAGGLPKAGAGDGVIRRDAVGGVPLGAVVGGGLFLAAGGWREDSWDR
jgi:hypothetical protein